MHERLPVANRTHCTDAVRPGPGVFTRRVFCALTMLVAAAGLGAGSIGMAPEPDPVPRRWELQIDPSALHVTSVNVPNVGAKSYIYMTYKAVNNSGQDVLFAPAFELSLGDGTVARSGRDVPQAVTAELVKRTQNSFIQDQIAIIGDILQGEEHAKEGIVIWPLTNFEPSEVTIYAAGFSGESKSVSSPDGKEKFVLRKTLRLDYSPRGDLTSSSSQAMEVQNRQWIMR